MYVFLLYIQFYKKFETATVLKFAGKFLFMKFLILIFYRNLLAFKFLLFNKELEFQQNPNIY
jgi:hypothetical protein